ncbi:nuclear transport factor 2 family protein [Desertivirga brevis]|uniref:nuclear transport factor 2 family protein n=1 Tax=Desertivirga brevis TaxID=2810310 RepID=UPI001A963FFC|nr:nuclear transport factor 2 family protein [Pedobacter sp. SYSU D00873]
MGAELGTQVDIANKLDITELVNRLFILKDYRDWERLKNQVFTEKVWFDMVSAGGEDPGEKSASEICELWDKTFQGVDGVHHQAGHYLIDIQGEEATVFAYVVATHFKETATKGKVRVFTGSYNIGLISTDDGWRVNSFKYNLKFIDGNILLE